MLTALGQVLWVGEEDASDVKSRLSQWDADLDRVYFIRSPKPRSRARVVVALRRRVARVRPVWVILDTWSHYLKVHRVKDTSGTTRPQRSRTTRNRPAGRSARTRPHRLPRSIARDGGIRNRAPRSTPDDHYQRLAAATHRERGYALTADGRGRTDALRTRHMSGTHVSAALG